jgi:Ca2+-binding EF-hand superfamily protein
MSKSLAAAVLFGAVTASTAVFAQGVSFDVVDSDRDGFVSFEELNALMPDVSEDAFKAADANQDNLLDQAEFKAVQP